MDMISLQYSVDAGWATQTQIATTILKQIMTRRNPRFRRCSGRGVLAGQPAAGVGGNLDIAA